MPRGLVQYLGSWRNWYHPSVVIKTILKILAANVTRNELAKVRPDQPPSDVQYRYVDRTMHTV